MNGLFNFIISPINGRYNNTKKIGDSELIVNTSIEEFVYINRMAKVISTPTAICTNIKEGDTVVVHHNIFRRWYDVRGNERNSRNYFTEDLYFCPLDQIYLYKNKNDWQTNLDYCFIHPIMSTDDFNTFKEQELLGIIKYSNSSLEAKGINPGALITFTPNSEFEFIVNGERLYCMKSNDIALTHEYQEDKVKYNPSWAQSR